MKTLGAVSSPAPFWTLQPSARSDMGELNANFFFLSKIIFSWQAKVNRCQGMCAATALLSQQISFCATCRNQAGDPCWPGWWRGHWPAFRTSPREKAGAVMRKMIDKNVPAVNHRKKDWALGRQVRRSRLEIVIYVLDISLRQLLRARQFNNLDYFSTTAYREEDFLI